MNNEFISPEGLRTDGRRVNEIRNISFKWDLFSRADGSAYFEQGNTKVIGNESSNYSLKLIIFLYFVLAAVYGPREVTKKSMAEHDKAIVNCEYTMASFSTSEGRKKKFDRRATEISLVIKKTFESVILTHLFPRTQIDIFMEVLQADGGTRCACINAASLALINAGIPMSDFVVSCAAGVISDQTLVDLNYVEDSASGSVDLPIAILPQKKKVVLLQMDSKLSIEKFEEALKMAEYGCQLIYEKLNAQVKKKSLEMASKRGIE